MFSKTYKCCKQQQQHIQVHHKYSQKNKILEIIYEPKNKE